MASYGVPAPRVSAIPHDLRPATPAKPVKSPATAAAHKGRSTVAPRPVDPFQPLTPAQIQATIGRYTGMYGTPQTPQQIQSSAQGMLDPIIAAITGNVNRQTQAATQSIAGSSASLAKSLAGIDYGAPYRGAEDKQAAVNSALQQSLGKAGGTDLAQGLEQRLSQIGGGSVQAAGQGIAERGAAIGTNQQAVGSGALGQLISNEASAQSYGQKLPGIAQLSGLQGIARAQGQGVQEIGSQTAQVMGQLPSIVENLRNAAQSLTGQKAAAAASLYGELTGQNITKATASAGLAAGARKLGLDTQKAAAGIAQGNARIAQGWAKLTEAEKTRQLKQAVDQANIALRGQSNTIAQQNANTSAYNAQIAAQVAAAKAAKTKNPTMTPGQVATLSAKAAKDAEDLYHGVTKPNLKDPTHPTVVSYTQTYQDALKTLLNRYPSLGRAGVTALANSWYKPGQFGRPKAAKPVAPAGPVGPVGG